MKAWLEQCEAQGGGDAPEAVADALHDVLKLSWRPEATKICILISDAPPHGLDPNCGDGFPDGDPTGVDPVKTVREMAEKQITLYCVGVEPSISKFLFITPFDYLFSFSIVPYRDFFMSLAYITGGQYVPMVNAKLLAQVIIGGVREEISLERLMQDAQEDINQEIKTAEEEGADENEITARVNQLLLKRNTRVRQMENTAGMTSPLARDTYAKCEDLKDLRSKFKSEAPPMPVFGARVSRTRAEVRAALMEAKEKGESAMDVLAGPGATAAAAAETEMTYGLKEDESVSMAQTERIIQRSRNRKSQA